MLNLSPSSIPTTLYALSAPYPFHVGLDCEYPGTESCPVRWSLPESSVPLGR